MNDYKRIVLYFALGLMAILIWHAWQKEFPPAQVQSSATAQVAANQVSTTPPTGSTTPVNNQSTPANIVTSEHNPKDLILVTTDVLNLKIDLVGGSIVNAGLKKYNQSLKDKTPYVLLNTTADKYYVAQSGIENKGSNQPIQFTSSQTSYVLSPTTSNPLIVTLMGKTATGVTVNKIYTFNKNSYTIDVATQVVNHSGKVWNGRYFAQTKRMGTAPKKKNALGFRTFFGIAVSSPDKPYQKFKFSKLAETPVNENIKGGWLAFIQHYFLTAWVPNKAQNFYYYSQANNNLFTAGLISPKQTLANGQQATYSSKLYIGPEIASNLNKLSPHLSLTIDYGWFWFISVILFKVLQWVYVVVGNWGWAIIITTLLIKLALYKLSETSYKSMGKMRILQPKIAVLKEQFVDDRQGLSRATMELYKKEKVNPLGGCLPTLVQIPVFIALYWVLIESVQLRQAPWIFWIHDLSFKDPYYILPVIMAGTMFLQQRMSPPPADPTQAKVMMFLPLVFLFLFVNFPAGLVLYWIVNNLATVSQQWYVMRKMARGGYKTKKSKKKGKGITLAKRKR